MIIIILNETEIYRFILVTKKVWKVTYQFLYLNSDRTDPQIYLIINAIFHQYKCSLRHGENSKEFL